MMLSHGLPPPSPPAPPPQQHLFSLLSQAWLRGGEQPFVWPSAAADSIQPWNVTSEPQMTLTLERRENTLDARTSIQHNVRLRSKCGKKSRVLVHSLQFFSSSLFTFLYPVHLHLLLFCTDILSCLLWLQGAIIIHEVYEEGAASKDGRLWAGDQILEVRLTVMSMARNTDNSLRSSDIKSFWVSVKQFDPARVCVINWFTYIWSIKATTAITVCITWRDASSVPAQLGFALCSTPRFVTEGGAGAELRSLVMVA